MKMYEPFAAACRASALPLEEGYPLRACTTLRLGGPAQYCHEATGAESLARLLALAREHGVPVTVIGRGSNLLVGDKGYRGMVICLGPAFGEIKVREDRIYAMAGATLSAVANAAKEHGLQGMEFASGIPGSVGGALVMNAGAYGGEMKDVLETADILEMDGSLCRVAAEELELGYRSSNIASLGRTVLGAEFRLTPGDPEEIFAKMQELNARRKEKQPLEYPSAGSAFKRPEGHFAGKLIEDAGLKGFRVGGAEVSAKHAGFVVNVQNATAADVRELLSRVQETVFQKSGVMLEPEIRFVGEF